MTLRQKATLAIIWRLVKLLPIDKYILYILKYFQKKALKTDNKVDNALLEALLITYEIWQNEKARDEKTLSNETKYKNMLDSYKREYIRKST